MRCYLCNLSNRVAAAQQRNKEGGCIRIIHAPGMPGIRTINYVQTVRPMADALDAHSNVRQGI